MYTTMYTMCAVHPCYHLSKITSASAFTQTLTPDPPPPAPHFEILFSAIELHHTVPGRRRHLGRVGRRPAPPVCHARREPVPLICTHMESEAPSGPIISALNFNFVS